MRRPYANNMQPEEKQMPQAPEVGGPGVVVPPPAGGSKRKFLVIIGVVLLFLVISGGTWWLVTQSTKIATTGSNTTSTSDNKQETTTEENIDTVTLDPAHAYGDKYADGLLPVGDKKYTTSGAKKGSVYMCNANFVAESQAGAQTRGPWFINNNTQWNINKKARVQGSVSWQPNMTIKVENGKRVLTTNDLPDHKTGVFPVASGDPAYSYDRNPNTISAQSLVYTLTASPVAGEPVCMGGEVGVMLTGVALFNAFDAGGRDAGAWEVQDNCDGHPQSAGEYHYHTLSRCITDVSVSKVIGYALDGFPITGPKVGERNYLTTDDLDACHGLMSEIMVDSKPVKTYHYVMTQDFPYSVSCFRATAANPPGQHEGQQSQNQPGGQTPPPGEGQAPPPYHY